MPRPSSSRLNLSNRPHDPLPHPRPIQVTTLERFIGAHCGLNRGVGTVLVDEHLAER
jgi:hypothetical protein